MKNSNLTNSSVVLTKNGKIGVVVSFNNKLSHIIFNSFTNPISNWTEDLTHNNDNYSISEVRDGSSLENVLDAFKKRVFETLPIAE